MQRLPLLLSAFLLTTVMPFAGDAKVLDDRLQDSQSGARLSGQFSGDHGGQPGGQPGGQLGVQQHGEVPKSYAVFVVAYDAAGQTVRGGVAGTAFFVTNRRAITAYHVLQPKSFEIAPGMARERVYLLHEGESPIELKSSEVRYDGDHDLTRIDLQVAQVSDKYVYQIGKAESVVAGGGHGEVETDGFVANTAGPTLVRRGNEIEIERVDHLERVHLRGKLLRSANVSLKAIDVTLNSAPCLQVSYQPIRGISGGPLLMGGKVVGMNSFADPTSRAQTWVVEL